jgi:hypothetical protein
MEALTALSVLGAVVAWLGVVVLSLADAGRGQSAGLGLVGAGLALAVGTSERDLLAAVSLGVGGLAAAAMRLRGAPPGWGLAPPGTTPRLLMCVGVPLAVALVLGAELATAGGVARLAGLAVALLAAVRLLMVERRWAALGAGAALALGLGALGGTSAAVAGAAVAVGLGVFDAEEAAETSR